jgi:hypothetical protein
MQLSKGIIKKRFIRIIILKKQYIQKQNTVKGLAGHIFVLIVSS